MKIKRIGMRTIKTVLAVTLAIGIGQLLNLKSPFFAGIAAIMAIQTSVSESLSKGRDRIYGTVLGAIIALIFSIIAPENTFFIGLGILIIIYVANIVGWTKSAQLSMIVFLSIMLNYEEGNRIAYALNRILDTLVGLVIGTGINYFIVPPKVEGKIEELFKNMYLQIIVMLQSIIWKEEQVCLEELKKDLAATEENYNIYKKDIKYDFKKKNTSINSELMFDLFEKTYNHLTIICKIEKIPYIDDKNKLHLQKLFNKEIPRQSEIDIDDVDIIYNYHLKNILTKLSLIEDMLKYKPVSSISANESIIQ